MTTPSFKTSGPKTRPERVRAPPRPPSPTSSTPLPPSFQKTRRRRSSASSSASSSSAASFHDARFPADEEQRMVAASNGLKSAANAQFGSSDYSSAISTYGRALAELPSYLDYELAVLQSNVAACHVKLEQWKEAIAACEKGLEGLERELPTKEGLSKRKKEERGDGPPGEQVDGEKTSKDEDEGDGKVVELPDDASDSELAKQIAALNLSDERKQSITRIRAKLLLRRARSLVMAVDRPRPSPEDNDPRKRPDTGLGSGISTWSNLSGAMSDYGTLSRPPYSPMLPASDQATVRRALVELPPRIEEAKQREVGEMMGKLKELGNGILKPFGLSTDMFKMNQDPNTGGWSMSFDGGGGGGGGGGKN